MAGEAIAVGPGKAALLAAVQEAGSISAAARSLGMSYKRAWYLLDTMNRCFSSPVVETVKGGRDRGGAVLTTLGLQVLTLYLKMTADAQAAMATDLAALEALLASGSET